MILAYSSSSSKDSVLIFMRPMNRYTSRLKRDNQTVVDSFNEWVTRLDSKADRADIERFNCFGDRYIITTLQSALNSLTTLVATLLVFRRI
jgi:hypothetical protein